VNDLYKNNSKAETKNDLKKSTTWKEKRGRDRLVSHKIIVPIEEEDSYALLSPMSKGGSSVSRPSRMRSNTHNSVAGKTEKEATQKAGTSIKTVKKEVNGVIAEEVSTPKRKKKSSKSKSKSPKSSKSPKKNSENLSPAYKIPKSGSNTPKGSKKKKIKEGISK
jgi:hypothetical protein